MSAPDREQLRRQIDLDMEAGRFAAAQASLERLWRAHPSAALAGYLSSRYDRLREHRNFRPCRVAVLRSFTVEPVLPLLRAEAWTRGLDVTVQAGGFNACAQELLDAASWVYGFAPDAVILAVGTQDAAPELWDGFTELREDGARGVADRVVQDFEAWIAAFRSRSQADLVVHTLEVPARPVRGILDAQSARGQADFIQEINRGLRRIAAETSGVHVLDYDALVAAQGRANWRDEQRWAAVKLPMRAEGMLALAAEWVRYLCPITGRVAKVLVTDLDNTLWGGVAGEDGPGGIQVNRDHSGIAWWNVQRALLDIKRRGILLAIASKNNRQDVVEVFRQNSGMPLGWDDFTAERINWQDKAASLREIAAELNLGLDSLAFLDDNPAERELLRSELPEVTVIELPDSPLGFAAAIRQCPLLERLSLSAEDADRGRHYAEQRERAAALAGASSLEDYYRSLAQRVEIAPVEAATMARAAQLTQKTNQFNLTTRRYSEQGLAALAETAGWNVYTVRVEDRFGDNGLVGVILTQTAGETCEIEAFLLSCRVISRTVETAMLSFLAAESRARGLAALRGWFLPTAKNAPASDCYRRHGFELLSETEGGSYWVLDLTRADVACPEWIEMKARGGRNTESMTTVRAMPAEHVERASLS
ncbi:MAG TPA: HAD-IIIC family phosphatase [Bryobacteraceae bacterium]|nr:HAD-IIIC family phosphatase [Bryobacteraceae bacterium]